MTKTSKETRWFGQAPVNNPTVTKAYRQTAKRQLPLQINNHNTNSLVPKMQKPLR